MAFKVCLWNLLHGKRVIRALNYIMGDGVGADIICLQEIPENVIYQLENSKTYDFFCAEDFKGRLGQAYLGILVRKRLVALSNTYIVVSHNNQQSKTPMGKLFIWTAFQQSQSVQVFVDGHNFQLINTHLDVNGSILERIKCLERVLKSHYNEKYPIILCGDLNTFGCWWKNMLFGCTLFGVPWSEWSLNEQDLLDDVLERYNLCRVFERSSKNITHPWTRGQLDHILCTRDHFTITDRLIMPAIHKSDHRALSTVFEFKKCQV